MQCLLRFVAVAAVVSFVVSVAADVAVRNDALFKRAGSLDFMPAGRGVAEAGEGATAFCQVGFFLLSFLLLHLYLFLFSRCFLAPPSRGTRLSLRPGRRSLSIVRSRGIGQDCAKEKQTVLSPSSPLALLFLFSPHLSLAL